MDIGKGKSIAAAEDEGTIVHVRNAGGEYEYFGEKNDKPVTITVVGTYSARYRRIQESVRDKSIKRRAPLDGRTVEDQALDMIAGSILSWDGFEANGAPFTYSRANAIALLESCPWIREQVETAMNDHAAFFKAS